MQTYIAGVSYPLMYNKCNLDHGVLLVGYGKHGFAPICLSYKPYWIIKNSQGPIWRDHGYYKICHGHGHSALLHACTVEDEAFVGMGATLLNGVVIEKGAFVAAGAVVSENNRIPAGQVWAGNPAKFLRQLKEEEAAFIPKSAHSYAELASIHAKEDSKSVEEILGQSPSEESAAGVAVQ